MNTKYLITGITRDNQKPNLYLMFKVQFSTRRMSQLQSSRIVKAMLVNINMYLVETTFLKEHNLRLQPLLLLAQMHG